MFTARRHAPQSWTLARCLAILCFVVGFSPASLHATSAILDSGTTTISSETDFGPYLYVGYTGTATMQVVPGGLAQSAFGYLGYNAGGRGVATITGGTWATHGDLTVGAGGSGALTMSGGLVTVGGMLSRGASGTITLDVGGTLQLGTGGPSGMLNVAALLNNGMLIFNRSDASTYPGVISGAGGILKQGIGTLEFSGANTHTGPTSIDQGTLLVTHSSALTSTPITVRTGGRLALPTATRLTLSTTSVAVDQATGGVIDVGRGRITIAHAGGNAEADLRADLVAGRGTGSFSGTSGVVTTGGPAGAAANPVVGYRVFASGSAVVAWSAFGDSNLDGQVSQADVNLIVSGGKFGQGAATNATWAQGDSNYSGGVTQADINLLVGAGLFGRGNYLPPAAVPEPGTGLLGAGFVVAALWASWRRRSGGYPT